VADQLTWLRWTWRWTWRWIKRTSIILGVILTCAKLFDLGAKFFRYELVARLERGAFGLPPQLDDFYTNLTKKLDTDTFVPRVLADEYFKNVAGNVKDLSDSRKEDLVRQMARLLPSRFEIVIPYDFKAIHSYWTGTITNSSSAQLTTVQLHLSGAKFALLTRDDNSKTTQSTENLINIGDLRPGEKVQISIWSTYGLDFSDHFYAEDVRLTHHSGVGKVTIPRLVTGLPAFFDKYDFVIYMMLVWVVVVVGISAVATKLESRQGET
jgi:hypothetical protein